MKKIKSYTGIWNVEKVIYAINDIQLPFPITFNQMTWFVLTMFFIIVFSKLPPLTLIDNVLIKYVAIPIGITWFMSKKHFDGKKPLSFLKSVCSYAIRSKTTFAGKPVKSTKKEFNQSYTVVRSEVIEIPN